MDLSDRMMTADDRIALILGRAIMRAERLEVEAERLRAEIRATNEPVAAASALGQQTSP